MSRPSALYSLLPFVLLLAACDQLGIDTPARQDAEARAIGGACRHSGRALQDCYISYPKVSKASIYAGWREMDAYMRDNHIDVVQTTLEIPQPAAKGKKKPAGDSAPGDASAAADAAASDAPPAAAPAK